MEINTKKRGRPVLDNPAKGRLEIRLTESQKKTYVEAAADSGKRLACWIRDTLDLAAKDKQTPPKT